jgi:hypothetical protein
MNLLDARRRTPRISVEGFCSVAIDDDTLHHAQLTSLSTLGVRIERPSQAATMRSTVQLEIELPGLDEVVWASAVVTDVRIAYLQSRRRDGRPHWTCRTGLQIAAISRPEGRLLRDYVVEQLVARRANERDRRVAVR